MKCEKHDWDWDISDPTGCPICYGERLSEERIIELLEPLFDTAENAETRRLLTMAIALIKGENK